DYDECGGEEELAEQHESEMPLHVLFRPPKAGGLLIDAVQPYPVDEKIRDENCDKHDNDGEDEAFGIHVGRLWQLPMSGKTGNSRSPATRLSMIVGRDIALSPPAPQRA